MNMPTCQSSAHSTTWRSKRWRSTWLICRNSCNIVLITSTIAYSNCVANILERAVFFFQHAHTFQNFQKWVQHDSMNLQNSCAVRVQLSRFNFKHSVLSLDNRRLLPSVVSVNLSVFLLGLKPSLMTLYNPEITREWRSTSKRCGWETLGTNWKLLVAHLISSPNHWIDIGWRETTMNLRYWRVEKRTPFNPFKGNLYKLQLIIIIIKTHHHHHRHHQISLDSFPCNPYNVT